VISAFWTSSSMGMLCLDLQKQEKPLSLICWLKILWLANRIKLEMFAMKQV